MPNDTKTQNVLGVECEIPLTDLLKAQHFNPQAKSSSMVRVLQSFQTPKTYDIWFLYAASDAIIKHPFPIGAHITQQMTLWLHTQYIWI